MVALFVALLPFLGALPQRWPAATGASAREPARQEESYRAYPLLLSFVPFIVVQTGVYTFLGEFGRLAAHLPVDATLHAIGISVILSSLGSVAAFFLNDKIGLRLPIAGAIVLMLITLVGMMLGSNSAMLFVFYISLLQIGWIFLNCYLYSALIEANNLLVPAATPFSTLGSVIGAGAMGYVLEHDGLRGTLGFTVGSMLLTALLAMPFLRGRVPSPPSAG
jgi:predicted MFS family arabinose efflux permease